MPYANPSAEILRTIHLHYSTADPAWSGHCYHHFQTTDLSAFSYYYGLKPLLLYTVFISGCAYATAPTDLEKFETQCTVGTFDHSNKLVTVSNISVSSYIIKLHYQMSFALATRTVHILSIRWQEGHPACKKILPRFSFGGLLGPGLAWNNLLKNRPV